MGGFLFWNTLVSCFLCVHMAVWEPLMIVNVTGKTSISPMDVWKEHEPRQRSQGTTTANWISNVTETSPFVSGRLNTWGNERPKMLIVQAANYKNGKMEILQSMQFNTTTVAKGFNHWMQEEYLLGPNKTSEFIESPAQLQKQGALFRYNYQSSHLWNSGVSAAVSKGGMTFLLDTQNVSERGSLLLTSNARNIGNIEDILFNLNTRLYVSSLHEDEMTTPDNTKERISDSNHKITRTRFDVNDNFILLRYEMEQGVIVKTLQISSEPTVIYHLIITLKGGTIEDNIWSGQRFSKYYDLEFLSMEITSSSHHGINILSVSIEYSYLPYDVADYFIVQGLFVIPTSDATAVTALPTTTSNSDYESDLEYRDSTSSVRTPASSTTSNPDLGTTTVAQRDTTTSTPSNPSSTPNPSLIFPPSDRTSGVVTQDSSTITSTPGPDTTTVIPTDTTSASIVVPAPTCTQPCGCRTVSWGNTTKLADLSSEKLAELKTMITELKGELTVNKSRLSTYRATKTSASDDRSSAAGIGAVGILVIIFAVALVVLADMTSFMTSRRTQPLHIS